MSGLIGSDFVVERIERTRNCSECGRQIASGEECLVSIKGGHVKKRVCSEACRQQFDHDYWTYRARERAIRERRARRAR